MKFNRRSNEISPGFHVNRCNQVSVRSKETSPSFTLILVALLGGRLKRRLRNLLVVTVVGLGTFYGYRAYRRSKWYHEMSDSDRAIGTKPRIVVLGTGNISRHTFAERIAPSRLGRGAAVEAFGQRQVRGRLRFAA